MTIQDLDANFANLFLESVENTFNKVLNKEMTRGQLSLWKNQLDDNDVAVLVGITGDKHSGMAVYSMRGQTAERMIQSLDDTYKPGSDQELLYDGLGEIVNILSGNTMTHMGEHEIRIDMSTPSVVAGDAFRLHVPNQRPLSVDMLSEFGSIEINLAVKRYERN